VLAGCGFAMVASLGGEVPPEMSRFLSWADRTRIPLELQASSSNEGDLQALVERIGPARIVAFGEGTHLAREPLEFRNRLFRYLVQHKGFTAIAIESGVVESEQVDEYVEGGSDDLNHAIERGIGWTFNRLPQNRDLLLWMRQYNQDRQHPRKLHFYGFDISGSPGNARANVGPRVALEMALEYLQRVDPNAVSAFLVGSLILRTTSHARLSLPTTPT